MENNYKLLAKTPKHLVYRKCVHVIQTQKQNLQLYNTVTILWPKNELIRMLHFFVFESVASFIKLNVKGCPGFFHPTKVEFVIK